MRCGVLADALAGRGWRVAFACGAATPSTVPEVTRHEILVLPETPGGEAAAMACRWPGGADLLVVDHFGRDAVFESGCRPWARAILVVDDLADRRHDADWLLDYGYGRAAADYDGLVPPACRRLIGPAWALLRPEFAERRPAALERRAVVGPVRRALIALGGTDPDGCTGMVLSVLAGSGHRAAVDVVLGPAAPYLEAVRAQVDAMPMPATLHVGSRDVAGLMAAADLAIGAGGGMSWERCCLGLPSITLIIADNQRAATLALERAGAVIAIEAAAPDAPARLHEALDQLWPAGALRQAMSRRAAAIVDGAGAGRVFDTLAGERTIP